MSANWDEYGQFGERKSCGYCKYLMLLHYFNSFVISRSGVQVSSPAQENILKTARF